MTMTDPIADMLARIRNAAQAKQPETVVPYSKLKHALLDILKAEGFIDNVQISPDQRSVTVELRYTPEGTPVIQELRRVSKPGRRRYVGRREIPRVMGGLGLAILSTPRGLMTDREARRRRLGGELICEVA